MKRKDNAPSKNPRPLSPLTAHQRAEIFEQANTVAVRIQLANAKQNQESEPGGTADVDAVIENSPFPVEFPVGDSNMVTSTPAEKVAPAVDEHFKNVDLEKSPNGVKSKSGPDANKQLKPTGMAAKGSILKPSTLFSKGPGMDQKPPDVGLFSF